MDAFNFDVLKGKKCKTNVAINVLHSYTGKANI